MAERGGAHRRLGRSGRGAGLRSVPSALRAKGWIELWPNARRGRRLPDDDAPTCSSRRRTSQYHAIHTGALSTAARSAIATGPSTPATSEAATVTAPGPTPAT